MRLLCKKKFNYFVSGLERGRKEGTQTEKAFPFLAVVERDGKCGMDCVIN
jgi:hypothetical protein